MGNKKGMSTGKVVLIIFAVIIVIAFIGIRLIGIGWLIFRDKAINSGEPNSNLPFGQNLVCYESCEFILVPTKKGTITIRARGFDSEENPMTIGEKSLNVEKGVRIEGEIEEGIGGENCLAMDTRGDMILKASCLPASFLD